MKITAKQASFLHSIACCEKNKFRGNAESLFTDGNNESTKTLLMPYTRSSELDISEQELFKVLRECEEASFINFVKNTNSLPIIEMTELGFDIWRRIYKKLRCNLIPIEIQEENK